MVKGFGDFIEEAKATGPIRISASYSCFPVGDPYSSATLAPSTEDSSPSGLGVLLLRSQLPIPSSLESSRPAVVLHLSSGIRSWRCRQTNRKRLWFLEILSLCSASLSPQSGSSLARTSSIPHPFSLGISSDFLLAHIPTPLFTKLDLSTLYGNPALLDPG